MDQWEYLRIAVSYRESGTMDFVARIEKTLPSTPGQPTHNGLKASFNVTHHEWDAYLKRLSMDGWELMNVETRSQGREESYSFKRPLKES